MSSFFNRVILVFSVFLVYLKETFAIQLNTNCTVLGNKYYDTFIFDCLDCYDNSESTGKHNFL